MSVRPEELAIDAAQLTVQLAAEKQGASMSGRVGVVVVVCDFRTGRRRLELGAFSGSEESIVEESRKMAGEAVHRLGEGDE